MPRVCVHKGLPLGPVEEYNHPRDLIKAAKVFGIDVAAKRNSLPADYLSRMKMAYLEEGAEPSHQAYGWVTV